MGGPEVDGEILAELLNSAGGAIGIEAARAVVEGVAAAPEPRSDDWMALVAADPPPALRVHLSALRSELAAGFRREVSMKGRERLAALRLELERRDLVGFVIPRGDEFMNEYVPKRAERLAWLTGFTGSAGVAVVLRELAALFVDGRYTLQARAEVDGEAFAVHHAVDDPPADWVAARLGEGERFGFDPWLHTPNQAASFREACEKAGALLVALDDNPIDRVWSGQPPPPLAPVVAHEAAFAGRDSAAKRRDVAQVLVRDRQEAVVLAAPDALAWLLNVRGGDVPYTPLPLAFAIVHADAAVDLFIDRRKLMPGLEAHLGPEVRVRPPGELGAALDRLGEAKAAIRLDPEATPAWIFERLRKAGARVRRGENPCARLKACKNPVELAGMRAAHRRDGASLVRFLAWLAQATREGAIGEITAARMLESFRRDNLHYRGPSFPTISAAGPNAAIVHYRARPATERKLETGSLYLVDSGAQYLDGTTDVTRTVAIGKPSAEMRDRFTRVLKGHIALASARFPRGTSGTQLDVLARRPLWEAGLDYDHGTGHGVGCHLAVHEGPQRISKLPNRVALEPGMVLSDEPGYYRAGRYGIRIESLVAVTGEEAPPGAERELYGFEVLTLVPIDRALIDPELLDSSERSWLDRYHQRVREALSPLVDAEAAGWLENATKRLAE